MNGFMEDYQGNSMQKDFSTTFLSQVNILNSMRLNQEQVTFKYTGCIRKFTDNGNRLLNEILA